MNRKNFLRTLGIGAASVVVAPKINAEPKGIITAPPDLSPAEMQSFIDEWRKQNGTIIYKSDADRKFKFDEIFSVWPKNENLIYFRPEHEVYQAIRKSIEKRIIPDKWAFKYYLPEHAMLLPVKNEYRMSDFDCLILYLDNVYNHEYMYCEFEQGTFLRLFRERDKNRMHLDLFYAEKRKA